MPFHFCQDELFAIMAMLPFMGAIVAKIRARWYARHPAKREHRLAPSLGVPFVITRMTFKDQ
jgi:hypothetical protein